MQLTLTSCGPILLQVERVTLVIAFHYRRLQQCAKRTATPTGISWLSLAGAKGKKRKNSSVDDDESTRSMKVPKLWLEKGFHIGVAVRGIPKRNPPWLESTQKVSNV